ncbi:hypothetical protein [Streptomyces arenae]|uniref:hypothetical protein n=1 Tax=Streptomyces arenae TaxID=29301 RepID=UPI00265B4C5D|nr:hypothetical protein [Streptomyces arenae]MCG7203994.1 hypothetical protein [Streptomyces arenae]
MSTINKPRSNQEPEPVRPRFARLFRRRPTPAQTAHTNLIAVNPAEYIARGMRQAENLRLAREDAERWKGHADSYERERDEALRAQALHLAWIAALHPATAVITPAHDGEGSQDLYIVAGAWQMHWSIPAEHADLFRHVTAVDVTDERAQWDGHGSEQRDERIRNHVRLLALEELSVDGLVTGVMTAPPPSRDAVLREAFEVAREEGQRLDYEGFTGKAAGARRVAYLLRRMITLGTPPAVQAPEVSARRQVLQEVWEALRDTSDGPLTGAMVIVSGLMEKAGQAEAEAPHA